MITELYNKLVSHIKVTSSGCWEWQRAVDPGTGYGLNSWKGKNIQAHRSMWLAVHDSIPEGLWVLHKCDNRRCCNPDHLFLGTAQDNMADMCAKGRHAQGPKLSKAVSDGWTPESRQAKSQWLSNRAQEIHNAKAQAAGVPLDWKYCPKCQTWKPKDEYYKNSARHDGLSMYCAPCKVAYDVANRCKNSR